MLNCTKIQTLLSQYATEELVNPLRDQVTAHLQQCPACKQESETELALLDTLGSLPLVSCPDQVTQNILDLVETEEKRQYSPNNFWWLGAATLVAAGLALILLLPQNQLGTPPRLEDTTETYTSLEIQSANYEARLALAKVASVINRNEKNAFEQVFGQEIPGAVGGSLLQITKSLQGEV